MQWRSKLKKRINTPSCQVLSWDLRDSSALNDCARYCQPVGRFLAECSRGKVVVWLPRRAKLQRPTSFLSHRWIKRIRFLRIMK